MEKIDINEKRLQDLLSTLSQNGYRFNEFSVANCEELKNASGFTCSAFELLRGINYRIYFISEDGKSNVYSKIADNNDAFSQFIDDFREISIGSDNNTNSLHIYLHQIHESISLKDFLVHNFDDNFKLQSVYEHFVSFYNVITKHNISIFEPKAERIALNADGEIKIKNLDYFICAECSENTSVKNVTPLFLNSIGLLAFLRVVTDNPELLVNDNIFLAIENGISEKFLKEHLIPFVENKEYRLLLSIITCIQQNKTVEIEISLPNPINTFVSENDWKNAKQCGIGWYSEDDKRFYGIEYPQSRYNDPKIKMFQLLGGRLAFEGNDLSIICDNALSNTSKYEDIQFSEGITTLGKKVFYGVHRIKRINFPSSLKAICGNPFAGVVVEELNNLSPHFIATRNALYSKGLHRLISYFGDAKEFIIPSQTVIIGDEAFSCNETVIEVTIGESVVEIGDEAFTCCSNLKRISLPNSLKRIGRQAFQQSSDTKLKELRIPKNVEFIGRVAFDGISKIECDDSPFFKIEEHSLLSKNGEDLLYYFGNDKTYRIPNGVKTVWAAAFRNNNSIEEIIVPHSVKVIEDSAFSECKQLSSVIFECDYLSLGEWAFFCCENLCSIKMPKEMGNINHSTFYGCKELSEIDIPEGVEIIGESAFSGCSSLKKIKLPHSIKTIDESAFNDCKNLDDVVLPEGLKIIGTQAFEYCSALSKITFPRSLEVVKNRAFSGCSIKECIVKSEMTIIYSDAFKPFGNDEMLLFIPPESDPNNYRSIIPEGVRGHYETTEGPMPTFGPKTENIVTFINDKNLDDLLSPPEFHYSYYQKPTFIDNNGGVYADGMQRLIDIEKDRINNKKKYIVSPRTKFICNNVFGERYSYLRAPAPFEIIVLPKNLVAIGDYCFANSRIKEINLPDSLEYIGDFAFMDCTGLSSFVIPRNVKHIGINPFYLSWRFQVSHLNEIISESPNFVVESNCLLSADKTNLVTCYQKNITHETSDGRKSQSMVDFIMPNGVKRICKYSFARVEVKSVTIPSSVEIIDEGAFENGLFSSISIPAQVKYIGEKAFSQCNALQNVDISKTSVTIIEKELFDGCNALESIALPDCSTSIGDHVFHGCKKLLSISLPTSIESIGANPFVESGISEIILNNDNFRLIDGILYGCEGKEVIAVLSTANKSIMIPEGVEIIRQEAFAKNVIIEEVTCPASLRVISLKAFAGCTSLRRVNLEDSSVEELAESVFDGCTQLETVLLPKHLSKIDDYAFQKCGKIVSLSLPNSIRSIKDKAFNGSGLKSIYLSYGLDTKLLPWSFRSKGKQLSAEESGLYQDEYGVVFSKDKTILIQAPNDIESYVVPFGTEVIGSGAFYNAHELKNISIPDSVKRLGNNVFNCKFEELKLPESVTEIGNNLFIWSHNMIEFIIPSSIKIIHGNPFGMLFNSKADKQCKIINHSESFSLINGILYSKDLKTLICCTDYTKKVVDILDSVEYINNCAFYGCRSKIIEIPDSVRSIGERSFSGISVSEIVIPETIETIGEQAFYHIDVPELHIPGSIKTISDKSFGYCTAVKIELSEGIKEIKHAAFTFCGNLEEISIPQSVDLIERAAFWGCHNLETIRFFNPQIIIANDVFEYCKKIKKVVVPKGSINRFRRDFPAFANRLEEAIENEA